LYSFCPQSHDAGDRVEPVDYHRSLSLESGSSNTIKSVRDLTETTFTRHPDILHEITVSIRHIPAHSGVWTLWNNAEVSWSNQCKRRPVHRGSVNVGPGDEVCHLVIPVP